MLFFMLKELVKNGIKNITVSTHNPYYWKDFDYFHGADIRFIPFGWSVCGRKPRPVGLVGRVILRLKDIVFRRVCIPLTRKALLTGTCPSYIKWFCTRQYWDAVGKADLVLGMGGHRVTTLLVEDVMIAATFDMSVVLLQKKPFVLWSQTIGPLKFKREANRQLIRKILTDARRIYIRDEGSEDELKAMGVPMAHVRKTRDSAFGLDDIIATPPKPSARQKLLGVAIYTKDRTWQEKEYYLDTLAKAVDYAAGQGYSVLFFPMGIGGIREMMYLRSIIKRCRNSTNMSILEGHPDVPEHISKVAECRLFLGHKTHSVVFALAAATPIVAIAYQRKTEDFMQQFGLREYCITDEELSADRLVSLLSRAEAHLDDIYEKEVAWMSREAPRVKSDFAAMLEDARGGF
jgi:polysaccharide pyruvyl transferase WcaK-like protein